MQAYIILKNIYKSFGDNQVLNNINLSISEYDFVAVVGKSGCGKSTLLRLLASLDVPNKGEVLFANKNITQEKSHIRLMFQEPRLLPWKTVIQNVGLGLKDNWHCHAMKALSDVGLQNKANNWPMSLSGGQKQRVALARALVHKPKLLLLDEPLGALDALTRLEMQQLIESLWKKYKFTVLLVTHDINEAVLIANRIILLDKGNIDLDVKVDFARPRINNVEVSLLENKILNRILSLPSTIKDYEI